MAIIVPQKIWNHFTMKEAVEIVEETKRQESEGAVHVLPTIRLNFEGAGFVKNYAPMGTLLSANTKLGLMVAKVYLPHFVKRNEDGGVRPVPRYTNFSALFDIHKGELLAMVETDAGSSLRTGAVTGVATKYLSREDSLVAGIIGTGTQARTQLLAICEVRRKIREAKVFSPNALHRKMFINEMEGLLKIHIRDCNNPEAVVTNSDIVVSATKSPTPVIYGKHLSTGTHVTGIGSNYPHKRELDEETVKRASVIVVDSKIVSQHEAGDLIIPANQGLIKWDSVIELNEIVSGKVAGRKSQDEITLFKSCGSSAADIPMVYKAYKVAEKLGIGIELK